MSVGEIAFLAYLVPATLCAAMSVRDAMLCNAIADRGRLQPRFGPVTMAVTAVTVGLCWPLVLLLLVVLASLKD